MDYKQTIPLTVLEQAKKYFSPLMVVSAGEVLNNFQINISFQKGNPETYFIISALLTGGEKLQAKVSFKKATEKISSNCSCKEWTEENHCKHTAALFIKFNMNHILKEELKDDAHLPLRPELTMQGQGAHCSEYGRIINSPTKLSGARTNSTYSTLQYLLTNRKLVNFPLAQKFKGKVKINLIKALNLPEFENFPNIENKYYPIFSHIIDGEEKSKISLFECLYLFDWDNGDAYSLDGDIRDLIKAIQQDGLLRTLNDYLLLLSPYMENDGLNISIREKSLKEFDFEEIKSRFTISKSKRKSFLDFAYELYDSKEKLLSPPQLFKLMTQDNGLLSGFRTKNDSYEFLKELISSLENEDQNYKKHVYSASTRSHILSYLDYLEKNEELFFTDSNAEKIYFIKSKYFKILYLNFFKYFGESASRFSFYFPEDKRVLFQIPKNQLLNGISGFHKILGPFNTKIFYNENEVKTWTSNIRFERQKSNLNWFEVNLVVDENDLEIIKNAQINDEFLVTNQGMILLDSKEKELLKFMKKYTKHESNEENIGTGPFKKFALNFQRSRIFELFELKKHGIEGALTDEEEKICQNLLNMDSMPKYDIPARYKDIAREYQLTGYNWLRFLYENRFGACLADDMGLGKTLQTIMFLQSIIDKIDRVLIVCPVSILINWQNEISKFSELDVHVYYGGDREENDDAKIILTSYGVMKREAETTFKNSHFDVMIMDEVQHLKNIRSLGAQAARNISSNFRICLTGTPVENDLSEFYNIMDLSIPGIWGELSFFKSSSTKKSRLLARQTVRPFILRRTKEQVLTELPEKEENHIFLSFNQDEKEHYLTTLTQIRSKMNTIQQGRKYSEILKSLLKLRQLCLWQKQDQIQSTKIDFLIENLEQLLEEGHKVLVFSQFTTYLDIIENKIREHSWNYARIDGSQNHKKRQEQVEHFQNGEAQVFLISLKAGGVGLNLTAASYIFLMDPWWNPAVESQAIDRAYRIGQENKLTVYRPIIKDSVEEKVLVLQNAKKELFKDLMAEDDKEFFNGKLSMDDFQALLN
jgi:SNF2 family DNA or RNA helicase